MSRHTLFAATLLGLSGRYMQETGTEGSAAAGGATEAPKTDKPKAEPAPIIRGRMPVAIVHMIRQGAGSVKEKSVQYATTVGKVDDIMKNRNFAYVGADFKPTEQMKADAIAWLKRHPGGAEKYNDLVQKVEDLPVASELEAKAFEETRVAARGQTTTTKEGEPVTDAGGGNRRVKPKDKTTSGKKPAGESAASATGDELLK